MPYRWLAGCSLWALGCTDGSDSEAWVDLFSWLEVSSEDDPFDGRPEDVECPPSSRVVETEGDSAFLEVDTGLCNYVTLQQGSLIDLQAGDTVIFDWGHRELTTDDEQEAIGHMALWLDQTVIEDVEIAIPASAAEFSVEVQLEEDFPAGTPVWLHLHNHGSNQWFFYAAEVRSP
jgi:hypothetical protein